MSNRNFDMSNYIRRQSNRVAAQSFLTRIQSPNNESGSAPYLGISSYSIMNEVRPGSMTEFSRSDYGGCELVNPGCPCPPIDPSLFVPTGVTNINVTFGSIILSWSPPSSTNNDNDTFTYEITPYLNGIALTPIITSDTTYRFADLEEWKPYTFKIAAINKYGKGVTVSNGAAVIMPPLDVSEALSGSTIQGNMSSCIKYLQGNAIEALLKYIAAVNLGPTKSSRLMYVWAASVAQAWNWISLSRASVITGIKDEWNWDTQRIVTLSGNNNVIWFSLALDHITSTILGSQYTSKFTYNQEAVNHVKNIGQWNNWIAAWNTWYSARVLDGSIAAGTTMPVNSANWDKTIIVDGTTVNDISGFPAPRQWTRLTVQGKKQGYMTWDWDSVRSTCLSENDEITVTSGLKPLTGSNRDEEIDWIVAITHEMGDPKFHPDSEPMPFMNSDLRKLQAEFWAGGPGTVSPPCMFIWMWCQYVRAISISADKLVYSLLDLCIHLFEGGRITWRLKKEFMEARPIQEIRRRYVGKNLYSWDGSIVKGDQWTPYQEANFVTPPFADFPSGHSHFSKAFALTMSSWFGDLKTDLQVDYCNPELICPLITVNSFPSTFGSFTFNKGSSKIQPGSVPNTDTTLSWNSWNDIADSAGLSRIYGGIHCLTANEFSQITAERVHSKLIVKWGINKAV
jgi:hypothetical protein